MSFRIEDKTEGFAISKIYPGALIFSQGIVYEITDVTPGEPLFLDEQVYNKVRQKIELVSDIALPPHPRISGKSMQEALPIIQKFYSQVRINKIETAIASTTPNTEMLRCPKCWNLSKARYFKGEKCPGCKQIVQPIQAPVSIMKIPASQFPNPQVIKPLSARTCDVCHRKGKTSYMRLVSPPGATTAPLFSLRWKCDCGNSTKVFAPTNYKLAYLMETYTHGITVNEVQMVQDGVSLDHGGIFSNYVTNVIAVEDMLVTSVTPGYRIGASYTLQATRRFPNHQIYARQFSTKGIRVTLNPNVYHACQNAAEAVFSSDRDVYDEWLNTEIIGDGLTKEEQDLRLKRWVLHSFAHGLLTMISEKTDLEATKFSAAYDLEKNFVVVYDNEFGGIGGAQSLIEDSEAFLEYLMLCRRTIGSCDCRFQCPRCLTVYGCGEVNQALFRHLIGPIFDIDTFYI